MADMGVLSNDVKMALGIEKFVEEKEKNLSG
jgi:hypothetical protein